MPTAWRASGKYPLTARGRTNTYPLFADLFRQLLTTGGRAGIIVPSGIATDDTTKLFFQDLIDSGALASLYDFENRNAIFPGVHRSYKFCLLTMRSEALTPSRSSERGRGGEVRAAEFVFFALAVEDLHDADKRFTLTAEDVALLNPNTRTAPIFRTRRDAEITKAVYRRAPVLIREEPVENPWGISFKQGLFNMTSDSGLFRTAAQLRDMGYTLQGNRFVALTPQPPLPQGEGETYLPLYEAKLMHQFDHRWATYDSLLGVFKLGASILQSAGAAEDPDKLIVRDLTPAEKADPRTVALPRYWVAAGEVAERLGGNDRGWLLGFRDIARSTDERTAIFGVLPRTGVGNNNPLMLFERETESSRYCGLVADLSGLVLDWVARQKLGGVHMNFFLAKQLPVLPPATYTPALLAFIVPRVLELVYTAWDLQPFAADLGHDGPPFVWDDARRFVLRCELDALYFHLYGIARDDVDYIMDTFPIVRRKDEAAYGEYVTKAAILQVYDALATGQGLEAALAAYVSPLDPPPGDDAARHRA